MPDREKLSTSSLSVEVCGRVWRLARAEDLETLWARMGEDETDEDERLPYWTEVWPAGVALCFFLRRARGLIRDKICIDMGCGLGLTAIVGQWLGARVLALDYERQALRYARENARRNRTPSPLWTVMDWRAPALAPHCARCIWGGDVMYERRFAGPILDFLEYALAPDGRAWMAEPRRSVYDAFREAARVRGWTARLAHEQSVEGLRAWTAPVNVRVWELTR